MVKNTVRFHESVVDEIESLVDEGILESKSEFYRFASEYVLELISEDYTPHMVDFESVKHELIPQRTRTIEMAGRSGEGVPFLESVAMVRKYALRGSIQDAEDFIDHHYDPNESDAVLLEEILRLYRETSQSIEPTEK